MPRTFQRRIWRTEHDHSQIEVVEDIPLDLAVLDMTGDLEADADTVAGNLGMIAELLGDYEEHHINADAEYRHWCAQRFLEVKKVPKKEGDKVPSDELTKKMVEADPTFLIHKQGIASLKGSIQHLSGIFDALSKKGEMVKAKVQMRNKQSGGEAGMDTRDTADGGRSIVREPVNREKMRDVLARSRENQTEEEI